MKRALLYFLIIILGTCTLKSQDVTVSSAFDSTRILIGDQVHFSVIVEQPADISLLIPALKDTLTNNVEIISGPVTDTLSISANKIRITGRYLVTSFDSGYYRVNPVFAELNDANGMKRFFSDYSILEVNRVRLAPPDTSQKIFDIAGPYRAPLTLGEILPWILIIILLSAIVWMVIRLIKLSRKSKGITREQLIIEPAHVIAFRELERLRDEQLWQKGELKKYYTRLTETVRQYLENRFMVYSLEMTTSETLQALVKKGFKKDGNYDILKSVLTAADLVKFAKYRPEPFENEKCFNDSWTFVTMTKEEEIPDKLSGSVEEGGKGK